MARRIRVSLLSGSCVTLEVEEHSTISELRAKAEQEFWDQKLLDPAAHLRWLVSAAGLRLPFAETFGDLNFGDEETLTGVTKRSRTVKSGPAYAELVGDGTVRTWGKASKEGPGVDPGLREVSELYGSDDGAFAALREDGSVFTWGHPSKGGDSSFGEKAGPCSINFTMCRRFGLLLSRSPHCGLMVPL